MRKGQPIYFDDENWLCCMAATLCSIVGLAASISLKQNQEMNMLRELDTYDTNIDFSNSMDEGCSSP